MAHQQQLLLLMMMVCKPQIITVLFVIKYISLFAGTIFGLKETNLEIYNNETEIEVCVEVKPPYNNTACPVDFNFQLQLSIEGDNATNVN